MMPRTPAVHPLRGSSARASRSFGPRALLLGVSCGLSLLAAEVAQAQDAPPPPPPVAVQPQPGQPQPGQPQPGQPQPGQPQPGQPPPHAQPVPQPYAQQQGPRPPPDAFEEEEEEPRSRRARRRGGREPRPVKLEWRPGEAIPTGYEERSGPSKRLLIGGLVTAGSLYVGSNIAAYITVIAGSTELAPLFAPVIGPFIAIETIGAEGVGAYLLVLNGLGQTAGVTLAVLSGFMEDTWLARLPTGIPLDDQASGPRVRADIGMMGGSFAIDF